MRRANAFNPTSTATNRVPVGNAARYRSAAQTPPGRRSRRGAHGPTRPPPTALPPRDGTKSSSTTRAERSSTRPEPSRSMSWACTNVRRPPTLTTTPVSAGYVSTSQRTTTSTRRANLVASRIHDMTPYQRGHRHQRRITRGNRCHLRPSVECRVQPKSGTRTSTTACRDTKRSPHIRPWCPVPDALRGQPGHAGTAEARRRANHRSARCQPGTRPQRLRDGRGHRHRHPALLRRPTLVDALLGKIAAVTQVVSQWRVRLQSGVFVLR